MKNLTKLINGVKKSSFIGLSALILYFPFSCATMTKAQKASLLGDVLTVAGEVGLPGKSNKTKRTISDAMSVSGRVVSKQASMQHDLEVANTGKNSVVINNNPPRYNNQSPSQNQSNYSTQNYSSNQNQNQNQSQSQYSSKEMSNSSNSSNYSERKNSSIKKNKLGRKDNSTPEGFFVYKDWIDFNNDGEGNRDEFMGLNDPIYWLDKADCLHFAFCEGLDRIYEGENLKLRIYEMESGDLISSFNQSYFNSSKAFHFTCEGVFFSSGKKYKAVLNTKNHGAFSLNFRVLK